MSVDTTAIRQSVALSTAEHISVLRVAGEGAFEALDRIVPIELFVRDGQILHTLLLRDDATPLADLLVCRQDESYLLLSEGASAAEIAERLRQESVPGTELDLVPLDGTHQLLSVDGPYAWELLADSLTPDVVGLPYLGCFDLGSCLCFRAGKTGEYGYLLFGERGAMPSLVEHLLERGRRFDLAQTDLAALDQCSLENAFFNIRREGSLDVTPIELQLQWRVSYQKDYLGAAALRQRRSEGARVRLVMVVGTGPLAAGDLVALGGSVVGRVVNAGESMTRGDWVALALVERGWAHPGLQLSVTREDAVVPVRSVSAPVINNRSLYVHPQRHSYFERDGQAFPPLE